MSEIYIWEIVFRLILSAVIGGLIGMERESNNRPAGLRTHVLVTLGACLVMLISMYGFIGFGVDGTGGDPARLAAQVVSGIGFLGAGTILRTGNNIRGLTTAASLWVCGCIGLAIGNGYYIGGLVTAAIVLFTLISLGVLEKRIFKKKYKVLIVECRERAGLMGDIGQILGIHNIIIKDIRIYRDDSEDNEAEIDEPSVIEIHFTVKIPRVLNNSKFFEEITRVNSVEGVAWEGNERNIETSEYTGNY